MAYNSQNVRAELELSVDVDLIWNFTESLFDKQHLTLLKGTLQIYLFGVLNEKRALRLIISTFQIDMTGDQILTVFVLIVAVLAIVELFHVSNYAHKANFLFLHSLGNQVKLVKVGVHGVGTNVVLLLLSLL
jgi:hypothetical protein